MPGFASIVISGFVNLNFPAIAERMADMPAGEIRDGVPPPKYTVPAVPASRDSASLYRVLISFNIVLIYSSSGIFSGVNDVKLQYGHFFIQKGIWM